MMLGFIMFLVMSLGFGSGTYEEDIWAQIGELPGSSMLAFSTTELYLDYEKLETALGDELEMMVGEWPPEDLPAAFQEYSLEELFDLARFEVRATLFEPEEFADNDDPEMFIAVRPLVGEAHDLLISLLEEMEPAELGNMEAWWLDDLLVSHDAEWLYFSDSPDSMLRGLKPVSSEPEGTLSDLELYTSSTGDLPGDSKLAVWIDLSRLITEEDLDTQEDPDNKGEELRGTDDFVDSFESLSVAITGELLHLRLGLEDDAVLPEDYQQFVGHEGFPTLAELVPEHCLLFGDAWLANPLLYLVKMIGSDEEEGELELREEDTEGLSELQTGEVAISLHAVPGEPRNEMVEELLDDTIDLDFERHDPRLMFYFGSQQSAELLTELTDLLLAVSPDNEPERSSQLFGALTAEVWAMDDGDIYLIPVDEALVLCVGEGSAEMFATSYGGTDNLSRDADFLASKAISGEPASGSLFIRLEELIDATTEDNGYPMPNLFQNGMNTIGLRVKLGKSAMEVIGDDELLSLAFSAMVWGIELPFSGKEEEAVSAATVETQPEPYE